MSSLSNSGQQKLNPQLLVSFGFGGLLLTTMFVLCFQFAPEVEKYRETIALNVAVFVAGWANGWVARNAGRTL